jgi:hypothetical protein
MHNKPSETAIAKARAAICCESRFANLKPDTQRELCRRMILLRDEPTDWGAYADFVNVEKRWKKREKMRRGLVAFLEGAKDNVDLLDRMEQSEKEPRRPTYKSFMIPRYLRRLAAFKKEATRILTDVESITKVTIRDMGRLKTGKMEPHPRWLEQRDQARRIYDMLESLEIHISLPGDPNKPSADGLKLMCAIAGFAFGDEVGPGAMRKRLG